ncbi:hypothetical protein FGO68_gene15284 [Halteria grandinella]|uniref:Uncharacterized protein n=1 Tax=Halteria grandinella TaxID=5974 RepID=A0A8J8T8I6_HALGN|nr:hypothetical protein FGO68_gene15284 [Halteria grandinella]
MEILYKKSWKRTLIAKNTINVFSFASSSNDTMLCSPKELKSLMITVHTCRVLNWNQSRSRRIFLQVSIGISNF